MKLAILHLSDIHFKDSANLLVGRGPRIAAALQSTSPHIVGCFITVTGDIAFSGTSCQYQIAYDFFSGLQSSVAKLNNGIVAQCIFIPGNHDCNLLRDTDARRLTVTHIASEVNKLDPKGELAKLCLGVQDEFFDFEMTFNADQPVGPSDRIYYEKIYEVAGKNICFRCYNTAWISQNPEIQGKLFFPNHIVPKPSDEHSADLSLSLFHHPYNWLDANNKIIFKKLIERTSDIILTGHEHEENYFKSQSLKGAEVHYVEGAVLQDDAGPRSGFNVILLDLDKQLYKISQFDWREDLYHPAVETQWLPFVRNSNLTQHRFENNIAFTKELSDAGTGFTHSTRRDQLKLDDIFVYPDLAERSIDKPVKTAGPARTIYGKDVLEYVTTHKKVLIVGTDISGKTALGKVLYSSLQAQKQIVPILVSGEDIQSYDEGQFIKNIDRIFLEQYSVESFQHYKQLDIQKKAIVIDDLHNCKFRHTNARNTIISLLEELFGVIIILAHDRFWIEEIISRNEDSLLMGFRHCSIKEFGHVLRGRLINKWVRLGREDIYAEADLNSEVLANERTINTLIGNNLLPAYPLTILTVLQTWESSKNHRMAQAGSYGSLYESLLTDALSIVSTDPTQVDTRHTYIAMIAYYLFENKLSSISKDEYRDVIDKYSRLYSISLNPEQVLRELEKARILCNINGNYRFKYQYAYYYYVARYFKKNLHVADEATGLREKVRDMTDKIYSEEYANILLFLIYLTEDPDIIDQLIRNARMVYDEYEACDLDKHVVFLNRMFKESPKLQLPGTDVAENREHVREGLDKDKEELGREEGLETELEKVDHVKYCKDLDDIIKINISYKMIQMLGQILRNFSGSLLGTVKLEIAYETYLLGLRTLSAIFQIAESNLEDLRTYFAQVIKEKRGIESEIILAQETNRFLIWLTLAISYGVIKKVSHSVGLETLRQTFREVLKQDQGHLSMSLIDLSIRLDHFKGVPETQIRQLERQLRDNNFAKTILRELVGNYLYLFEVDLEVKQSLGALLDIKTESPQMLFNPSRKRK